MTTARHIIEEWKNLFNISGKQVDIFGNPTESELKLLGPNIRFIAYSKTKTLYVWDAHLAIHNTILSKLNLWGEQGNPDYMLGEMTLQGAKYKVSTSSGFSAGILYSLASQDWSWTTPYQLDLESYFKHFRQLKTRRY